MKRFKQNLYKLTVLLALLVLATACKKYVDPALVFEEDPGPNYIKDRKVLIISIDGLSGLELKHYVPTQMKKMLAHAKYSFDGFSDADTGDAASWTTILSGKSSQNHGVEGNDFDDSHDDDDEDDPHGHQGSDHATGFVTVYQRLLESGRLLKSLSVSPWVDLDQHLFYLSHENGVVESDEAAKDKAVDRIKNGDKELAFAVVNFRGVNNAGLANGFTMDAAPYKAALDVVDGYLAEIVAAVEARENYAQENWLIIITSNHGGLESSYGGATFEERKVPLIYYNLDFKPLEIESPSLKNSLDIRVKGNVENPSISAENSMLYDIKNNGEYSIMFKVYNYSLPIQSSHAVILGRTTHAYSTPRGWHFMVEGATPGNRYRFLLGNGSVNISFVVHPESAKIDTWETVALKIFFREGLRYARIYVNGVPNNEVDVTGKNFETDRPDFFIGSGNVSSLGTFNGKVNNLVFIDKALTDEEIQAFSCLQDVDPSLSYWNNIQGYWPMVEGSGHELYNKIETTTETDFHFNPKRHSWTLTPAWSCLTPIEQDEEAKKEVMYTKDILPQVFYWLNIKTDASWKLEGTVFLTKYEREFLGKTPLRN